MIAIARDCQNRRGARNIRNVVPAAFCQEQSVSGDARAKRLLISPCGDVRFCINRLNCSLLALCLRCNARENCNEPAEGPTSADHFRLTSPRHATHQASESGLAAECPPCRCPSPLKSSRCIGSSFIACRRCWPAYGYGNLRKFHSSPRPMFAREPLQTRLKNSGVSRKRVMYKKSESGIHKVHGAIR